MARMDGEFMVTMVSARHDLSMSDDPTLPTPHFLINTQAELNFYPSDPTLSRRLPLDITSSSSHRFPSLLLTADSGAPGSLSWSLISSVVDDAQLDPFFPKDTVQWVTNPWAGSATTPLEDRHALVRQLLHTARSAAFSPFIATRKTIPISISFDQKVMLPTREFIVAEWAARRKEREDWLRLMVCSMAKLAVEVGWSREELERTVGAIVVVSALMKAKKKPVEEEVAYERRLEHCAKRMATYERALILAEDLPEVTVDGGVPEDGADYKQFLEPPDKVCPICLEGFFCGEVANCMPCACANVYHRPCVVKCLDSSDSCPTCRFVLPLPAM